MTGAEALVRSLQPENIRHVFGVAGGKIAPLLKALSSERGVHYTGVRHEATGAYMAAAIYAATGHMALTFSELGPGTGNIIAGVASAFNNRLPLLVISSNNQHAASYPSRGMFMEMDNAALLRPITKWNAVVHDGRRIPELMRSAFRQALTGRHGPVHLDIPQDVLLQHHAFADSDFTWTPSQYRMTVPIAPDREKIATAATLLLGAMRPLLIAGGGVARSGATAAFRSLADALHAPVTTTQSAVGVVSARTPHFLGCGGLLAGAPALRALREADVILAAGCRFSSWLWDRDGPLIRHGQKLIHIDTDPVVIGSNVPVEVGILACASLALPALTDAIQQAGIAPEPSSWKHELATDYTSYRARLSALASERSEVMHPAALAREIGRCLPRDAMVTFDGGHTSFWSNDFTEVHEPQTAFHEPGMAQLGFGLPYALALQLTHPGRPVVNITGDGAFGFTLPEMDTARRYRLPIVNIIHNNSAWGVIAMGQAHAGFTLGTDLMGTDYAAIGRGFGGYGENVTSLDSIGPALERAFASGLPAVLDCKTRFVPHPMLAVFGQMGQVGIAPQT